jgi:hypothetical protein
MFLCVNTIDISFERTLGASIRYHGVVQIILDISLQALESQLEFYKSEESQRRFRHESYRGLADYYETKANK